MPLVGVIESGTVSRVLQSVAYAKANVLVLFEKEGQSGHVLYERGRVVTARLDRRTGIEALSTLESWSSGHYSLLKREQKEVESNGHVLLNSLNLTIRRPLERWLRGNGFTTSIVGYPQHAQQVISYIQPEVVLMSCPHETLGITCNMLSDVLTTEIACPPLLIVVESEEYKCTTSDPWCVKMPPDVKALEKLLCRDWPSTRYGARQESYEETARVYRPEQLPAGPIQLSLHDQTLVDHSKVSIKQLAIVFTLLAVGSGLIWAWWWWSIQ